MERGQYPAAHLLTGDEARPIAANIAKLPVARLVRDLLDRVGAEPGLVGAILDDGDTRQ